MLPRNQLENNVKGNFGVEIVHLYWTEICFVLIMLNTIFKMIKEGKKFPLNELLAIINYSLNQSLSTKLIPFVNSVQNMEVRCLLWIHNWLKMMSHNRGEECLLQFESDEWLQGSWMWSEKDTIHVLSAAWSAHNVGEQLASTWNKCCANVDIDTMLTKHCSPAWYIVENPHNWCYFKQIKAQMRD